MIAAQRKFRRFLAVLLSASFVWTAMACVSLCLLHSSEEDCAIELSAESVAGIACVEESSQEGEALCADADSCCEPDCCPMKPLPVCALQKSSSFDFQLHGDYQISPVNVALPANARRINNPRYLLLHVASDPPFERLCTLRI